MRPSHLPSWIPFIACLLLILGCSRQDSYRPGKTGHSWTYTDSSTTNSNSMVRERVERLGENQDLTTADGRTVSCRTLEIISNGQPLSRIYFEDLGEELRIHRLDHLPANEVIRYDPCYPMLAPTDRDTTLRCLVLLSRGEESEPYHRIEVGLKVSNQRVEQNSGGKTRSVLVQQMTELGPFGMTYRNTWLKGFGLLEQEIRGSSPQFTNSTHILIRQPLPE
jgi:hypothetical protein